MECVSQLKRIINSLSHLYFMKNQLKFKSYLFYLSLFTLLILIVVSCRTSDSVVREQIEWIDFWWKNEPDNTKPRILFIGNSISRGYYPMVSENLSEKYNCDRFSSSRSIADPALIKETKIALGKYKHSVIHFNNGLHGWHLNAVEYEAGMRKYVKFLISHKAKDCKLIYSLTTPVPSAKEGEKLDPVKNEVVLERNRIARKIMEENNIPVIDLYSLMEKDIEQFIASKGDVHYNKKGYERIATRITERIANLLNENTAIFPVSKIENDSYDWWTRHSDVLKIKDSINPEVVLIGNSITHFWGGEPELQYLNGAPRKFNGPNSWSSVFDNYRVLNLGFGWDRTQNVLWRLNHGEMEGLHPRLVVIHIGTNNTSETENVRKNSAEEIVEGIKAVYDKVHSIIPDAKIVLMAIMPREQEPANPRRQLINETNRLLKTYAEKEKITLVDIGDKMLSVDGTLSKDIAGDYCHPTNKGYQIWADAIRPFVENIKK